MFTEEKAIELFNEFLELVEFNLMKTKDGQFWLYDCQGADLGNISEERFETVAEVLDRLTIYEEDYILEDLLHSIDNELGWQGSYEHWDDLLKFRDKMPNEYQWDFDVLDLICNCWSYNIPLDKCFYVIDDEKSCE